MAKEAFKSILTEFHESAFPDFVPRDLAIEGSVFTSPVNKIITIIGPRRAGKTTYLFQIMGQLIERGSDIRDFIYVNFEDERILPLEARALQLILDAYHELYGPAKKPILFLDEIQNIPGWEKFVRRINEKGIKIVLTGSNSRMLARDLATALRGRTIAYDIFPFSFTEYLKSRDVRARRQDLYGRQRHLIRKHFEKYFFSGGYPEIALVDEPELQTRILQTYFDAVFYRDLVDRYKIRNSDLLRQWLNVLLANISAAISFSKVANDFKSRGLKVSKATLSNFARYVEDIYFGFFVEIYSSSARKRQANPKKFYLVDLGLHNHLTVKFSENRGRLLENLVFLKIRREGHPVFYYKTRSGFEVDFIVKEKNETGLIQVCSEMERIDTYGREKRALIGAMSELGLKTAQMITFEDRDQIEENGMTIDLIPVWQWLLSPGCLQRAALRS